MTNFANDNLSLRDLNALCADVAEQAITPHVTRDQACAAIKELAVEKMGEELANRVWAMLEAAETYDKAVEIVTTALGVARDQGEEEGSEDMKSAAKKKPAKKAPAKKSVAKKAPAKKPSRKTAAIKKAPVTKNSTSLVAKKIVEDVAARSNDKTGIPAVAPSGSTKKARGTNGSGKHAQTIHPLVDKNQRRPNTISAKSVEIVFRNPGISIREFLAKGGRMKDVWFDVKKGWMEVRGAEKK